MQRKVSRATSGGSGPPATALKSARHPFGRGPAKHSRQKVFVVDNPGTQGVIAGLTTQDRGPMVFRKINASRRSGEEVDREEENGTRGLSRLAAVLFSRG